MRLFYHPASTTSRPLVLFAIENRLPLELQVIDLFTGEHHKEPFVALNPNCLVPVLEDGEFRMTESSAILKYLADKVGSPLYPRDLQARARVNERMDWISTQLSRDLCYGVVYPQIFPMHKRRSEEAQDATLRWGQEHAQRWLKVMNDHLLGPHANYLCGDAITIADYYAASFVALAELVGADFSAYPHVQSWLARMKSLRTWKEVNEVIDGFGASLKGQPMVAV